MTARPGGLHGELGLHGRRDREGDDVDGADQRFEVIEGGGAVGPGELGGDGGASRPHAGELEFGMAATAGAWTRRAHGPPPTSPTRSRSAIRLASHVMGAPTRLDQLDLSQRMGRREYEQRVESAQRRLLQLRLHLGGAARFRRDRAGPARPPRRSAMPPARAGRSSASSRTSIPATTPSSRTRRRPPTRSVTTSFAASSARSPGTVGCACSTAAGTAGSSSSASRATPPRSSGSGRTRRSSGSSERSCSKGVILVKFWLHISDEEQLARFEARAGRPAEALETHRGGLAQPRQEPSLRRRRRGRVRPHRSRARPLGRDRRRAEALRPRRRARAAQRTDRGRDATVGRRGDVPAEPVPFAIDSMSRRLLRSDFKESPRRHFTASLPLSLMLRA